MDDKHSKRKQLVDSYFKALPNYPKISVQSVFDNLRDVWELMKDNDCLPNMTIEQFVQEVANSQASALMKFEMMKGNKPPMEKVTCIVRNAKK